MVKHDFDVTQPENWGRPFYFDMELHKYAIIQMICADEIEIAFQMLEQVPAWYRENYPKELTEIKNILFKNLYDSYEYSNESAIEPGWTKTDAIKLYESGYFHPRADVLAQRIKELNDDNERPWIFELSPSHGAMILGFIQKGLKFSYYAKNLNAKATDTLREWLPTGYWQDRPEYNQTKMLVCFEAMEHCYREQDIEQAAKKDGHEFDEVFLSVPYGCLFGGLPNWDTRKLGHVRGYTVNEFIQKASSFFKGYNWQVYKAPSIVLWGKK